MDPVERTVQYRKWDGSLHWRHDLVLLGEDAHGIWLGGVKGATIQKGTEPPTGVPVGFVQLVRPEEWWTAIFNAPGVPFEIYIDLCTPADWVDEHTVEFIDLDLDVIRRFDGPTELLDEDEFEEHATLFNYPQETIERTAQTARELLRDVAARREPFGTASQVWLKELTELADSQQG